MFPDAVFLYVEDDPSSRRVMQLVMNKAMGIQSQNLVIFEDSAQFMTRLKALPERPDVILLDIQVHPQDGFAMLNMLRADPDYQNAIVVALTACVTNEEIHELRAAAFPGLLQQILNGESVWHIV